jgi:hypothetical protein
MRDEMNACQNDLDGRTQLCTRENGKLISKTRVKGKKTTRPKKKKQQQYISARIQRNSKVEVERSGMWCNDNCWYLMDSEDAQKGSRHGGAQLTVRCSDGNKSRSWLLSYANIEVRKKTSAQTWVSDFSFVVRQAWWMVASIRGTCPHHLRAP